MKATAAASKVKTAEIPTETIIHIVGKKSLNTELLVDFMARNLDFTCLLSPIESLTAALDQFPDRTHLLFLDWKGSDTSVVVLPPELQKIYRHPRCCTILYNVDPVHGFEIQALKWGIRGILYAHQRIELFPRAVRAVLNGELFYSREFLAQFIITKNKPSAPTTEASIILTQREREVVTKLAEGCTNQEIARQLHISPNTVKTHAYNIYKKIKVSSRIQATLWLANSS